MTGDVTPDRVLEAMGRCSPADARLVRQGFAAASYWHRDQKRASGDPYITHAVAVAAVVAELGMDVTTVCAALLHDVTDCTRHPGCPSERLRAEFGDGVAALVDGLARLERTGSLDFDRRVLVIKLADRLHNLQTIRFVARAKQERKSRETLDVLVPLAGRLGLDSLSSQLETLARTTLRTPAVGGGRNLRTCRRVLAAASALLPRTARARWAEEWTGELHALPDGRARLRFTVQVVIAAFRLAAVLRNQDRL